MLDNSSIPTPRLFAAARWPIEDLCKSQTLHITLEDYRFAVKAGSRNRVAVFELALKSAFRRPARHFPHRHRCRQAARLLRRFYVPALTYGCGCGSVVAAQQGFVFPDAIVHSRTCDRDA